MGRKKLSQSIWTMLFKNYLIIINLGLKFVSWFLEILVTLINENYCNLVTKPVSFWIGRSTADLEESHSSKLKRQSSQLAKKVQSITELVMDDRWVPVSRRCAMLVDSDVKLWSVVVFAVLTMVVLIIKVCLWCDMFGAVMWNIRSCNWRLLYQIYCILLWITVFLIGSWLCMCL